jgi:hypothetical protein
MALDTLVLMILGLTFGSVPISALIVRLHDPGSVLRSPRFGVRPVHTKGQRDCPTSDRA